MASILACHAGDPGSIPGGGDFSFCCWVSFLFFFTLTPGLCKPNHNHREVSHFNLRGPEGEWGVVAGEVVMTSLAGGSRLVHCFSVSV